MVRPKEFVDADRAADAVEFAMEGSDNRRVSHEDLMEAAKWLGAARDKESEAGNGARAREINQLALGCFVAAIRVEDIDLPAVSS